MAITVLRLATGSETWKTASKCASAEIEFFVTGATTKAEAISAVFPRGPRRSVD